MNKPIDDFKEYVVEDVLGHIEGVAAKRMFGGYCLYLNGAVFGLITSDTDLYFKVDASNKSQYEQIGSHQFIYAGHKNKKPTAMPYWHIPEEVMENKEKIEAWVRDSAAISKKK